MRLRFFSTKMTLKEFFTSFKGKHRLVVVDDETLKEKVSIRLTGINVFIGVGLGVIILVALTTILIAFTPLREFIPGYSNDEMVEETYHNAHVIDSLEHVVDNQAWLLENIQSILLGKEIAEHPQIATPDSTIKAGPINYKHSRADSLLRKDVETRFNIKL